MIASVGLSLGVFTETAYTVIVIVPLITSIFAAVSLRIVVRDWRGTDKEQERLDREEALAKNVVVTSQRILLPSKGHPASIAAAQLAQFAWPKEAPSTILTVGDEDADISVLEAVLDEREVDHNRSSGVSIGSGRDVAASIVAESNLGYGVVVVGVAERHEGVLYSPMVDELLLNAVTPVVIVRRARGLDRPLPPAFSPRSFPSRVHRRHARPRRSRSRSRPSSAPKSCSRTSSTESISCRGSLPGVAPPSTIRRSPQRSR